jgi:D-arabinose 1-dehydrogenase-like Zn-dependent alcohol dehydrogenase
MVSSYDLPPTMKALVLKATDQPPTIEVILTPQPAVGSAVVRVLVANTLSYIRDIYNGKRNYPFPTPLIPGSSFLGRVCSVGPDATAVKAGDLVVVDILVRSRDQPTDMFLAGIIQGDSALLNTTSLAVEEQARAPRE